MTENKVTVTLPRPHPMQQAIIDSTAKRKIVRAGRRSGKTIVASIIAVKAFLNGERVLYGAPTEDQLQTFWFSVKDALQNPIDAGIFTKNEVTHIIELPGTKQRLRGKTCYNVDTLRGDYCSVLILDEWQLMDEQMWAIVGAPMLLDSNGSGTFIYTPPSLTSRSMSKARDPLHSSKMFKKAQQDKSGRWETFHFSSFENPYISHEALNEITQDMTNLAYRQEIKAEDIEESPGALWTRKLINQTRVTNHPDLIRIVVGVDPTGSLTNETGIIIAGVSADGHGYVIDDKSLLGTPGQWADAVLTAFNHNKADLIVTETNFGGLMCEQTITQAAKDKGYDIRHKNVQASRGKAVRAEPVVAAYERGKIHHVGEFPYLEDEMSMWIPGSSQNSPNRLDALVWAITELNEEIKKPTVVRHPYMPTNISTTNFKRI